LLEALLVEAERLTAEVAVAAPVELYLLQHTLITLLEFL
jgi:hypothetical protein